MTALPMPRPARPRCARLDIALEFEGLSERQIALAIRPVLLDCGGTYVPAEAQAGWGPVEHEVSLLGVLGTGDSLAAAARNWTRNALRLERALGAGGDA